MDTTTLAGKALLTGASGFIGGRLRDELRERGVDVVSLRRPGSPPAKHGRSVEGRYDDVQGLAKMLADERPDYVFHVAGVTKGVTYEDFRAGNVLPTESLLAALRDAKVRPKRFVHFSSLAAFGPSTPERPHSEADPRRPIEFYGQSKLEAEHVLEADEATPWTILRPGGVYGPGDVDYFNLFQEVERRRNVFFGNRKRWFSAVYADDLVAAAIFVAAHPGAVRRGFFVCDGRPITWEQFQAAIVEASGKKVWTLDLPEALVSVAALGGELATRVDHKPRLFNRQKAKMGAQSAWTCTSEALRALGWSSTTSVANGVRAAYAWYRAEKWL